MPYAFPAKIGSGKPGALGMFAFAPKRSGGLSNLTTFTVDGVAKTNGATVNLANGVTSATIAATNGGHITTGPTGAVGLVTGDNECTFTITAEDAVTTLDVTINLHVLDTGAMEKTQIAFSVDGSAFENASPAKYLTLYSAAGPRVYWGNTGGTETEPSVPGAVSYTEVSVSAAATLAQAASAFYGAIPDFFTPISDDAAGTIVVEDLAIGPRTDATITFGGTVTIITPGAAPA